MGGIGYPDMGSNGTAPGQGTSMDTAASKNPGKDAAPRDRIVAVAEGLFARKGLHGAPLREIAREAAINVNLVSYYFPEKEDLFNAVVDLRAGHLNDMRERLLEQLDERHSPRSASVEEIIHSLVHPFFVLRAEDPRGWSNWTQLLNRETGTELWTRTMARNLGPVLRRYLFTLHRAIPTAHRADILFVLELATRAMVLAAEVDQTAILPEAVASEWSDDEIETRIVRSLTAAALAFGADRAWTSARQLIHLSIYNDISV